MKRYSTSPYHLVTLLACALFIAHCPGGGGAPGAGGGGPQTPPTGLSAGISNSVYVKTDSDVYRIDIAPNYDGTTKGVVKSVKPKGFVVKNPLKSHLKFAQPDKNGLLGITPYGEAVIWVQDQSGSGLSNVSVVGLDGNAVNVLSNRNLEWVSYDGTHDQIIFAEKMPDGTSHLKQRDMAGQEKEIFSGNHVSITTSSGNFWLMNGEDGSLLGQLLALDTLSLTPVNNETFFADPKGAYVLYLNGSTDKKKAFTLAKSADLSQKWDLNVYNNAFIEFLDPNLQEFDYCNLLQPLNRLNLKDGSETTLSSASTSAPGTKDVPGGAPGETPPMISSVIAHVGEQFLIVTQEGPTQQVYLKWLNSDGSMQQIADITHSGKQLMYAPQSGLVLFKVQKPDHAELSLVSAQSGKTVATLNVNSIIPTTLYPDNNTSPVFITTQLDEKAGVFNIGLLSPDTLGGASGTDLTPTALGSIPQGSFYGIKLTDVFDSSKVRKVGLVADTTLPPSPPPPPPACVAKCDGKSCGDDGCGGMCGTCAAGSSCDAATSQCVVLPPPSPVLPSIDTVITTNPLTLGAVPSTVAAASNGTANVTLRVTGGSAQSKITIACGQSFTLKTGENIFNQKVYSSFLNPQFISDFKLTFNKVTTLFDCNITTALDDLEALNTFTVTPPPQ